jgi:hypothetical protein
MSSGRRPVDIASLAAFRILFGTVMCLGILRFLGTGWIQTMYGDPQYFFTYPGFGWVRPWPVTGMYIHYSVLAALALCIALGYRHRLVTLLFTAGFAYTQLLDVTNYLNHHYLVVLLGVQLALLPANAQWSLDARRDPALRRAVIPAWMVWLLRFQVGVVYVFAGLAKAKYDWLCHAQPLQLWLAARSETPLLGPLFATSWFPYVMSWAGFLFDTTIVVWLSWPRTRLVAFACVIVFHGLTGYLFNIGMFPLIMTTSALIFFSPSWPRRILRALGRPAWADTEAVPLHAEPLPRRARLVRWVIAVHVTVQLVLPLRHLLYPGAVLWNEDGMRFAWHVMIREKHGGVRFVAKFANGKQLEIPPGNYLTPRQERELGGQPDLILQLGRHIGRELRAQGYGELTLHAITQVSLNGRTPQRMIDPSVDLMTVDDLGPRTWVLPGP